MLPKSIQTAIDALSDLPGIGSRSAERLVFSLLRNQTGLSDRLADSLGKLSESVRECQACHNYCESELCPICQSSREHKRICVVESPIDVLAIEKTHEFKGRYHVLHGVISPMNKVSPDDLRIASLLQRLQASSETEEVILAMSGNVEGEATALYLTDQIHRLTNIKVSRLARGIPSGGDLDYLDVGTLSRALIDRGEV